MTIISILEVECMEMGNNTSIEIDEVKFNNHSLRKLSLLYGKDLSGQDQEIDIEEIVVKYEHFEKLFECNIKWRFTGLAESNRMHHKCIVDFKTLAIRDSDFEVIETLNEEGNISVKINRLIMLRPGFSISLDLG